ncbi:MAG: MFS transporter [Nitrospirae bacterium]|nr:MFS transporter [Nitrospirota bacterium]
MTSRPPTGWRAVWLAMRTWRTAAVSLLSFSSGLPLGLVWIAIPTWLAQEHVDIKLIGLFTLAQAPWTFKFLWSPFMDRYAAPVPKAGRKLGWALLTQLALFGLTLALAGVPFQPNVVWIVGSLTLAMAFASASQDIAIDAYAVEVLRPEEQGVAVGARIALYRAAMFVAGGLAISLAGLWSWPAVFALVALCYLPMMVVTWFAPRSECDRVQAPQSLRAAVWEPFVSFLAMHRSLEILAFVILYKLADNLAGALVRPFLVQVGFDNFDVGLATATIGLFATLIGTLLGGVLTTAWGLGNALWLFGALQILSNLGYVAVAEVGVNRPLMYAAMGFESLTTGMGTGAFSVLLLRMTQKRFSATQYALFSSLFAVPRILAGPVTGVLVDAIGWRNFFLFTIAAGLPGMLLLQRFCPVGRRDPDFAVERVGPVLPLGRTALVARAMIGGMIGFIGGALIVALLGAMKRFHAAPEQGFDLFSPLVAFFLPQTVAGWVQFGGVVLFGGITALATAATFFARSGGAATAAKNEP